MHTPPQQFVGYCLALPCADSSGRINWCNSAYAALFENVFVPLVLQFCRPAGWIVWPAFRSWHFS